MHTIRPRRWMYLFASGVASFGITFPLRAATLSTSVTCGDSFESESARISLDFHYSRWSGNTASATTTFSPFHSGGGYIMAQAQSTVTGPQSFINPQSSAMLVYDEDPHLHHNWLYRKQDSSNLYSPLTQSLTHCDRFRFVCAGDLWPYQCECGFDWGIRERRGSITVHLWGPVYDTAPQLR